MVTPDGHLYLFYLLLALESTPESLSTLVLEHNSPLGSLYILEESIGSIPFRRCDSR